jgi:hypothetical protein
MSVCPVTGIRSNLPYSTTPRWFVSANPNLLWCVALSSILPYSRFGHGVS